ncbi:MAG: hypothetical protein LBQ21_00590 [Clostridiales Family XIII bacterium]|jgi:hypothetical protein|nr:hypothetical protein [Clostridiales Family XIII bacterium]
MISQEELARQQQAIFDEVRARERERGPDTVPDLTEDNLSKIRSDMVGIIDRQLAEELRAGMTMEQMETQKRRDVLNLKPPAELPELPEDETVKLSASKRKKARKRQRDNEEKATRLGYEAATGETLPMRAQIVKSDKIKSKQKDSAAKAQTEAAAKRLAASAFFDVDMFNPSFSLKTDTSIDITAIRRKIDEADLTVRTYRELPDSEAGTLEVKAQFLHLEETMKAAQAALTVILGCNGLSDKGEKLSREQAGKCKEEKAAAIDKYRSLVSNRREFLVKATYDELSRNEKFTAALEVQILSAKASSPGEVFGDDALLDELRTTIANPETSQRDRADAEKELAKFEAVQPYKEWYEKTGIAYGYFNILQMDVELRKSLDDYPEAYAKHKDAIDQMFTEYLSLQKFVCEKNAIRRAITFGGLNPDLYSVNMEVALSNYITEDPKYNAAQQKGAALRGAITHLLTGAKAFPDALILLQEEYRITTDQRRDDLKDIETLEGMKKQNEAYEQEQREINERKQREAREWTERETSPTDPNGYAHYISKRGKEQLQRTGNISRFVTKIYTAHVGGDNFSNQYVVDGHQIDPRIFTSYLEGFDLDEQGEPLTLRDAHAREKCRDFAEAVFANDHEKTKSHLDAFIQELTAFNLTPSMLEDEEYLVRHNHELMSLSLKHGYLENLETSFPWYFESLSAPIKEWLAKVRDLYSYAIMLITAKRNILGVDHDSVLKDDESSKAIGQDGQEVWNTCMPRFKAEWERIYGGGTAV